MTLALSAPEGLTRPRLLPDAIAARATLAVPADCRTALLDNLDNMVVERKERPKLSYQIQEMSYLPLSAWYTRDNIDKPVPTDDARRPMFCSQLWRSDMFTLRLFSRVLGSF